MVVLDSNIIIYAVKPGEVVARDFLIEQDYCVSAISLIEVLGYQNISPEDDRDIRRILRGGEIIWLSENIVNESIRLRRLKRMSLPDAAIAATALCCGCELATRNVADFKNIDELRLINPFDVGETDKA